LYKEQWLKLLDMSAEIHAFIAANEARLKTTGMWTAVVVPERRASQFDLSVLTRSRMTKAEAWSLLVQALGLFGGGAVVTIALAAFVSKFMADRSIESHKAELGRETEKLKGELAKETETHKLNLKKREILYQKEIEAASAFIALHRFIEPKYRHPEMDWDEALDDVVESFSDTENRLRKYIAEYGAALSTDNRNQINSCMMMA